ncbi:MAG: glycosyltransferase family 4 protein, partial [Desulfovibrionaceae bacterium]
NKILILPNAVDTSKFVPQPADRELKAALGLSDRSVVGFVGSVTNYEGLEYLIDATLELNTRGAKVSLLIVGDGNAAEKLKDYHKLRGNHPAVVFAGRVPFDDVPRYYSIIDIMAFPRINAKVCHCVPPLKPLEAMAMGKPVIISDVAALCEIVQHEKTGLICRANDTASLAEQLGRLVEDTVLYSKISATALQWVKAERDWSTVSTRILQVYEGLLV